MPPLSRGLNRSTRCRRITVHPRGFPATAVSPTLRMFWPFENISLTCAKVFGANRPPASRATRWCRRCYQASSPAMENGASSTITLAPASNKSRKSSREKNDCRLILSDNRQGPLFDLIKKNSLVRDAGQRRAMRNQNRRATLGHPDQRFCNSPLVGFIQRRGRLVENEHLRIGQ